jgi:hypothetical protein
MNTPPHARTHARTHTRLLRAYFTLLRRASNADSCWVIIWLTRDSTLFSRIRRSVLASNMARRRASPAHTSGDQLKGEPHRSHCATGLKGHFDPFLSRKTNARTIGIKNILVLLSAYIVRAHLVDAVFRREQGSATRMIRRKVSPEVLEWRRAGCRHSWEESTDACELTVALQSLQSRRFLVLVPHWEKRRILMSEHSQWQVGHTLHQPRLTIQHTRTFRYGTWMDIHEGRQVCARCGAIHVTQLAVERTA